jgi:hypothetical protein
MLRVMRCFEVRFPTVDKILWFPIGELLFGGAALSVPTILKKKRI